MANTLSKDDVLALIAKVKAEHKNDPKEFVKALAAGIAALDVKKIGPFLGEKEDGQIRKTSLSVFSAFYNDVFETETDNLGYKILIVQKYLLLHYALNLVIESRYFSVEQISPHLSTDLIPLVGDASSKVTIKSHDRKFENLDGVLAFQQLSSLLDTLQNPEDLKRSAFLLSVDLTSEHETQEALGNIDLLNKQLDALSKTPFAKNPIFRPIFDYTILRVIRTSAVYLELMDNQNNATSEMDSDQTSVESAVSMAAFEDETPSGLAEKATRFSERSAKITEYRLALKERTDNIVEEISDSKDLLKALRGNKTDIRLPGRPENNTGNGGAFETELTKLLVQDVLTEVEQETSEHGNGDAGNYIDFFIDFFGKHLPPSPFMSGVDLEVKLTPILSSFRSSIQGDFIGHTVLQARENETVTTHDEEVTTHLLPSASTQETQPGVSTLSAAIKAAGTLPPQEAPAQTQHIQQPMTWRRANEIRDFDQGDNDKRSSAPKSNNRDSALTALQASRDELRRGTFSTPKTKSAFFSDPVKRNIFLVVAGVFGISAFAAGFSVPATIGIALGLSATTAGLSAATGGIFLGVAVGVILTAALVVYLVDKYSDKTKTATPITESELRRDTNTNISTDEMRPTNQYRATTGAVPGAVPSASTPSSIPRDPNLAGAVPPASTPSSIPRF